MSDDERQEGLRAQADADNEPEVEGQGLRAQATDEAATDENADEEPEVEGHGLRAQGLRAQGLRAQDPKAQ